MLSSITPLGERSRGNRWWLTVTAFFVAAVLGGALQGAAWGGLGALLRLDRLDDTTVALVVAGLAVVALAFDAFRSKLELPTTKRQVNEDWISLYRGWVYGAGWGFQLGLGLATVVVAATEYLVFALELLTASPVTGAVIGTVFGITRGLTVFTGATVDSPDKLVTFHRRMQGRLTLAQVATVAGDVVVLAGAAVVLARA